MEFGQQNKQEYIKREGEYRTAYNRGMAKDMQCLQAILDCMKKEKAEYHTT